MATKTEILVTNYYLPAVKTLLKEQITKEINNFRDERLNPLLIELAAEIASRIQLSTESYADRLGEHIVVTVNLAEASSRETR